MNALLPNKDLPWPICWEAVKLIAESEGCRLEAYNDIAGVPTIGWGHTGGVMLRDTLTQEAADKLLCEELTQFANELRPLFRLAVPTYPFGAMVSLAYNIGVGAFKKSSVLRLFNEDKYDAAAEAFKLWNKARINGKLTVVKALTLRRLREIEVYRKHVFISVKDVEFPEHSVPDAAPECERPITVSTTWQGGAVAALAPALALVADSSQQVAKTHQAVSGLPPWLIIALTVVGMIGGIVVCWRIYKRKKDGKS